MELEVLKCHHCHTDYYGDDRIICEDCINHGVQVHFDFEFNEHIVFQPADHSVVPF